MRIVAYEQVGSHQQSRACDRILCRAGLPRHRIAAGARRIGAHERSGIVLNLLLNGVRHAYASNVLVDEPLKLPGVTHAAFVVPDLEEMITALHEARLPLSGGSVDFGRRRICFVRDPDGTVVGFDELKDDRRSL